MIITKFALVLEIQTEATSIKGHVMTASVIPTTDSRIIRDRPGHAPGVPAGVLRYVEGKVWPKS